MEQKKKDNDFRFKNKKDILPYIKNNFFYKKKSLYASTPFHYHLIPCQLRKLISSLKTRIDVPDIEYKLKKFNLYSPFNEILKTNENTDNFPESAVNKIIITFDIDSMQGYKQIDKFLKYTIGGKKFSTIVFIPAAAFKYSEIHLTDLKKSGAELGCHGFDHSGKLAFDDEKTFSYKIIKIKEFSEKFNITKFRAPAFVLTEKLYEFIKSYFSEDYSLFDTVPEKNKINGSLYSGILTDEKLKLVVLNTYPDCLLYITKLNDEEIFNLWSEKIQYLTKKNIVPVFLFHPEPHFSGNKKRFETFKKFIDFFS
ncbi:hypothetical protein KA977_14875 [Candidatus Dependentiae bacterium]|nr:hypothetical protein [Candidatus Dependentiae bacterium]